MIKKLILTLWILSLWILNYSFAGVLDIFQWELPLSFYMNEYYNTITKWIKFESIWNDEITNNRLNLKFDNSNYKSIFRNNWKIYLYADWSSFFYQWYYNKFCTWYSETWNIETTCSNSTFYNIEEFYNLENTNFTNVRIYPAWWIVNLCIYNENNKYYYCFDAQQITWSLNIPRNTKDFTNYADSSLFDSSIDINITWQNIYCPTIQQVINNYNSKWFYSWLCYTFWKIYNWSSFEDVPVQSIFDVFSWKYDYLNWYQWYVTYCKSSVYNPAVCSDYFSWNSLKYNIFAKIPDISMVWWWKLLYNYCELYNYDLNVTTCVASWVVPELWSEITNNDIVSSIWDWEYKIVSPVTDWTVFSDLSWSFFSWDIITNIQQLFLKFTSLFKQQTWNTSWILPLWILIPFIIIVLFKLFKK